MKHYPVSSISGSLKGPVYFNSDPSKTARDIGISLLIHSLSSRKSG